MSLWTLRAAPHRAGSAAARTSGSFRLALLPQPNVAMKSFAGAVTTRLLRTSEL